jgi:hypothetical protein
MLTTTATAMGVLAMRATAMRIRVFKTSTSLAALSK